LEKQKIIGNQFSGIPALDSEAVVCFVPTACLTGAPDWHGEGVFQGVHGGPPQTLRHHMTVGAVKDFKNSGGFKKILMSQTENIEQLVMPSRQSMEESIRIN